MSTVLEDLQAKKTAAEAEVAKIDAEIQALPSAIHNLLSEEWAKIKAYFHANPAAAAPTPVPPVPPAA